MPAKSGSDLKITKFIYIMLNKKQKLIAKIFNNPIGRKYLCVPKGKKIYKITKSSAHYYTGDISKKNGLPTISTGYLSSNKKLKFIDWLENWKPIHLCWFYERMGWRIPKYFIGLDTGLKNPAATGDVSNEWTNPTNAYASDDTYATFTSSKKQDYYNFDFGISELTGTVEGVLLNIEGHTSGDFSRTVHTISWDGGSSWTAEKSSGFVWNTGADEVHSIGGEADTWGRSWGLSDFSDSNFRIETIGGSVTDYSVDHIKVKVYYTEVPPTTTSSSTSSSSSSSTSSSSSSSTSSSTSSSSSSSTSSLIGEYVPRRNIYKSQLCNLNKPCPPREAAT